jgi:hypothetical protein
VYRKGLETSGFPDLETSLFGQMAERDFSNEINHNEQQKANARHFIP